MKDNFNGDNAKLVDSIEALLALDASGSLVPHSVGGHARTLLEAAAVRPTPLSDAAAIAERDAFERWAYCNGWEGDLFRTEHGEYADEKANIAFAGWQAHAALATTEAPMTDAIAPTEGAKLAVWYGPMPESNGKTNWTAILHKGDVSEGITIDRSEYPDRVRYEADRMRWMIGELADEPWILDYDADKHSGYAAPSPEAPITEKVWNGLWDQERIAMPRLSSPEAPAVDAMTDEQWEELRRIARTYNETGFPKHAREFFSRVGVDALTTGAAAYDMAYANGNRGLVYPEELAHIEKARIVTGYVATPLYFAHPASEPKAAAIHYPECWDTAAYPTVESALSEVYAAFKCTNHIGGSEPKALTLTDEQIIEIARDEITLFDDGASICTKDSLIAIARAIEIRALAASDSDGGGAA